MYNPYVAGGLFCVVAHHFWDRPGGGELVMASLAVAAERLGYTPVLTSLTKFRVERYVDWFGIDLGRYPVVAGGISLKSFGLYQRLFVWRPVKKALELYSPRLVVIDMPTYKPIVGKVPIVEYIHFPLDATFNRRYRHLGFYYRDDPYTSERYGKFPLNIYAAVYARLYPIYARDNPFEVAELVLTNSRWTGEVVKALYGEEPLVLNPPLPPNLGDPGQRASFEEREPCVVMLGRYSHEKRYHWVLERVAPLIVKEVPEVRLVIMGDASTPTSASYYQSLASFAEFRGLKNNVTLLKNLSRGEINRVLSSCRVFLHATINEHWGIAVAEAMWHGVPVVVHKSGGAWTDLAQLGEAGIGYKDEGEAVEALARLLSDGKMWRHYSNKSLEKARDLTFEKFVDRATKLLSDL
jgi:glycosyltransferase involved in cell wall biosynthesis